MTEVISYIDKPNIINNKTESGKCKLIYELIEEQVSRTPNKVSLEYKGNSLTYQELNDMSNQLARRIKQLGVQPNDIVCIMINRSFQMLIGILGALKAGVAFLPIDPGFPQERIKYMIADSKARIILTQTFLRDRILFFKGSIININEEYLFNGGSTNLEKVASPSDLAYVIYTSGSTGKPKGVMIEHRSIVNLLQGILEKINIRGQSTILALTTISFDIFVLETLIPLTIGLKIVIADENEQKNPKLLNELIISSNIDILQITPSRVQLLLNYNKSLSCFNYLKIIMVGGESLPQILLEKIKGFTKAKIFNMYGPTETTVWSTVSDLTENNCVNIGMPIRNTQIYIIDENNNLVTEGELCIGGNGLSRGYISKPEVTSTKFVNNPFISGQLIYKTGDLARWLPDGNIEFLGRMDNQIKIRGYRIELGEIETFISKYKYIKQAVVTVREGKEDYKYLCAYFVADKKLSVADLQDYLQKVLPDYMIPAYFIRLTNIPQTLNGKIDRKALPAPESLLFLQSGKKVVHREEKADISDTELKIREIIRSNSDVPMTVEQIEVNKNLTDVGINSVTFIKIIVAIEAKFKFEFGDEDLDANKFSTIKSLISYVENMLN